MTVEADLIEAYDALAELTRPMCDACPTPPGPTRCCFSLACEITAMVAREQWGVVPQPGDHPSGVSFLAPEGCTVAAHLRPHCSSYVCPDALAQAPQEAQEEYHAIRAYITRLEGRLR